MTTMFPIQKGVPVPPIERQQSRRKWPIENMEPGDFFFVPGRSARSASAYVSRITADLPGKFRVQRCWAREQVDGWKPCRNDDTGAIAGAGVWRLE